MQNNNEQKSKCDNDERAYNQPPSEDNVSENVSNRPYFENNRRDPGRWYNGVPNPNGPYFDSNKPDWKQSKSNRRKFW